MPTLYSLALRLLDRARIFLKNAEPSSSRIACALGARADPPIHLNGGSYALRNLQQRHRPHRSLHRAGYRASRFNWKIGIGLICSIFAREVMVSTMGTLYAPIRTQAFSLQNALHTT